MRLPHERYIRFLITNGLDLEDTNEHLQDKGLGICPMEGEDESEYWTTQYDLLHDSKIPKSIKAFWKKQDKKKLPKNFFSFMNTVGLKEAWMYNVGDEKIFTIAMDALEDEDVFLDLRCLLALRSPMDEVSALINGKYGMAFPRAAAEMFQSYFFETRIMSRGSWREYLATLPGEHKELIYKALVGRDVELRAELDFPNRISVSEHYQKLHIYAMEKFNTYRKSADSTADQNAIKWAQIAMSSGDKYEKLKLGDTADFSKDIQMEFDYIDADFPMIGEETLEEIKEAKTGEQKEDDDDGDD